MSARVLVVGLDAADARLLQCWASEGALPAFANLRGTASEFSLANTLRTLPGGIWPEFANGRSCGVAGFYFPPRQLRTGEASPRPVEAEEVDPQAFWTVAAGAGRRVGVIDVPWSVPASVPNLLTVTEWGSHDRPFGAESRPPDHLSELVRRYGEYPLNSREDTRTRAACDAHDGSAQDYALLLRDLLEGLERKEALFLDLLRQEDWDLFVCAFGEPQCVGHQFWHFYDPPTEEATAAPAALRTAVRDVYARVDAALAALVAAAGEGATVILFASHGMAAPTGGPQLIPEVLVRFGLGSGHGVTASVRSHLPTGVRTALRRALPRRARRRLQAAAASLPVPLESPETRAVCFDGDRVAWVRLNVKGREPLGSVTPGAEAETLAEEIRSALIELEHANSGERIISQVTTAREAFGPEHHADVPDLMVDFREDIGRIDACRSGRVGLVQLPYRPPARRTGAHPAQPSWLWIAGPGRDGGGQGRVIDVAPTVLALLGVSPPNWMAGQPLVERVG